MSGFPIRIMSYNIGIDHKPRGGITSETCPASHLWLVETCSRYLSKSYLLVVEKGSCLERFKIENVDEKRLRPARFIIAAFFPFPICVAESRTWGGQFDA